MKSESLFDSSFFKYIKEEYDELQSAQLSLKEMLSPEINSEEFSKEFSIHLQNKNLKNDIQEYGEKHNIWLPNSHQHITCAFFLFPNGIPEKVLSIGKNLTYCFYLNDIMGRDTIKFLSPDQYENAKAIVDNISKLNEDLLVSPKADPLEFLNIDMLKEFKNNSTQKWFSQFLRSYCYYIGITHKNHEICSFEQVPSVDDFLEYRCHSGGMYLILDWIEYSEGKFLNWEFLEKKKIDQSLKRLYKVVSDFAISVNDLVSFEKEVIWNKSRSNLLVINILNNPGISLHKSIDIIAEIIRTQLTEIFSLSNSIKIAINEFDPEMKSTMENHLIGVNKIMQSSWIWQCHTSRYKSPTSLWVETKTNESVST
ncbi:terpene synthase family protein [Chryseobacterium luteum]|uniref:Terpene synthase n=1 Tax=Chryseobacterium luteum TaxID=421531 RepID=A0A085ZCK6_9FLAO|nr:terpene synthase family protein [Chryseobacterium luteum]KFF02170.1 hypothetical protein IX38_14680 [Chryseobacterium luteum]